LDSRPPDLEINSLSEQKIPEERKIVPNRFG
jgi:hypothetical protein